MEGGDSEFANFTQPTNYLFALKLRLKERAALHSALLLSQLVMVSLFTCARSLRFRFGALIHVEAIAQKCGPLLHRLMSKLVFYPQSTGTVISGRYRLMK